MHDLCLIHTDLKPEIILLVSPEYVKAPDHKCYIFKSHNTQSVKSENLSNMSDPKYVHPYPAQAWKGAYYVLVYANFLPNADDCNCCVCRFSSLGLGPFELEALQDWEYKFMSKYVKVGSIKKEEVPVADGESATEKNEGDVAKPVEDGPLESAAIQSEETPSGVDAAKE
ncbi:hypothetical protein Q3G72_010721 [Acer saccharum]|nr:hypothetical protein Q3G72_010721 [Acer saccharum]